MLTFGQELNLAAPFKGVTQFAEQAKWNLMAAHNPIIANHVVQTNQANKLCCEGAEYQVGDLIYLLTENLSLPKGQVKKLLPKYIRLYKVCNNPAWVKATHWYTTPQWRSDLVTDHPAVHAHHLNGPTWAHE
jgi:hypothetical protein